MKYAGFWIRTLAHLIDFTLLNVVEVGLEYAISLPLGLSAVAQQSIGVILSLGLCYFYYVSIPMKHGTTLGKKIFGIYVLDARTGLIFTRNQAIGRMFAYLLSYATIGCGFLMVAFHPQKRGLHDLLARTVSVRCKKGEEPLRSPGFQPEQTQTSEVGQQ